MVTLVSSEPPYCSTLYPDRVSLFNLTYIPRWLLELWPSHLHCKLGTRGLKIFPTSLSQLLYVAYLEVSQNNSAYSSP